MCCNEKFIRTSDGTQLAAKQLLCSVLFHGSERQWEQNNQALRVFGAEP
jgi:hypothetical protein